MPRCWMRCRLLVLSWALVLASANAQDIVLFGDSLSDNGNGYAANAKFVLRTDQTYPEAPYYQGRWSNGPTWVEVAASQLGRSLTDYGAGGATTGSAPAQVPPLPVGFGGLTLPTTVLSPTLPQQLNMHFLATNNTLDPSAIYTVLIGVNDYLSIAFARTNVTATLVVDYIEDALQQLYDRGARQFLLVANPDVSMLPTFTQPSVYGSYPANFVNELSAQVMDHNMLLQELVSSFPSSSPGSTVNFFDFGAAFMQVVLSPAAYGFNNIMQPCYIIAPNLSGNPTPTAQPIGAPGGQLCSDPDAHVFWDQFHPTRNVHAHIAAVFVQQLGPVLFGLAPALAPGRLPTLPSSG